jgi:thiol-disulfide isomerase/thioredoxin
MKSFLLSGTVLPAAAIKPVNVSEVFPYDETAQLTGGYIAEWLRKFRRNELTPRLKSAPVPTKRRDEHHIHVLVGDTFEKIVQDAARDVVILLYSSVDCPPCDAMHVEFAELATRLKDVSTLRLAKLDVKDNGVPERMQLTILPAIRMVKARDNEIVQYTGSGSEVDIVAWMQHYAAHDFKDPKWL